MGIRLPTTQFASYNGFVFPPETKTTTLRIEPVASSDGRTTLYNRWVIGLKFEIATKFGTTDPLVSAAITALSHQGGPFVYRGRGMGNPDVNTGAAGDIKFGPVPRPVTAELVGSGNAVELSWQVEFHIPNCPAAFNPFGVLEFSMSVSHELSDAGYVNRSHSGFLAVANNRTAPGSRRVLVSADQYRGSVLTPLPRGFKRKGMRFSESPDLSRLDFSWQDVELPVPLPEGIIDATFEDDVGSTGGGLARWTGSVNATYRMAAGYNWLTAARAFFATLTDIMNDRNRRLNAQQAAPPANGVVDAGRGKVPEKKIATQVIPTGFRMKNPNRYGEPAANFSFTYTFSCPLSDLLAATGMHLPLKHDYGLWLASMAASAHNPYGSAGVLWAPQDDPGIVDACFGGRIAELRGGGGWEPPPIPGQLRGGGGGGADQGKPQFEQADQKTVSELVSQTFQKPAAADSWVDYKCEIFVEGESGVIHVKKLPATVPDQESGLFGKNGMVTPGGDVEALKDFASFAPPWFKPAGGGQLQPTYTYPGIMRRTAETCVVYLKGSAVRVGFPINPPRLYTIGGVPCVPDCRPDRGEGFAQGVMGNAVNSLNYAYWNLRYVLPAVPAGPLPIPPIPTDKK